MAPSTSRHVAVIGAGAAGLVVARELRREGHAVVVFEKEDQVGGAWVYTQQADSDPLGVNPARRSVHSSLYSSLRTNIARECMGFMDFPFVARGDGSGDPRRYPIHGEVLMYLKEFARVFGVKEMVRFKVEVVKVWLVESNKWKVRSKKRGDGEVLADELFDAVVVCSGRCSQPHIADVPGIDVWPGKQMHSHNYRIPEPFRDQVVIVVGNSLSGQDISRDMARIVKEVHVASKYVVEGTYEKNPAYDNMWLHSMIESAHEDGTVVFQNGRVVLADVILHCTGYDYHFPFLETNGIVTVDDNRVGPLYKHVFPPALAPWLSFVGITWRTIPFPMFELQSKWIAGVLSGRIKLPSQQEMMEDINAFYSAFEASGKPKRHTHAIIDSQLKDLYEKEYTTWLGAQCGCQGFEEWRVKVLEADFKNKSLRPETFRDEWEDQHVILEAEEEFTKYASSSNGASDVHL